MANGTHLEILRQGVQAWNAWREANPQIVPDLSHAELQGSKLWEVNLQGANLRAARFMGADLNYGNFIDADLQGALINDARAPYADFSGANLQRAYLWGSDFRETIFREAVLRQADFRCAQLVMTKFEGADLTGCKVYGTASWDIQSNEQTQFKDLVVSRHDEPTITVDDLEVAQFVYLLLHNEKIRKVIDTVGNKAVLILGRFTEERKAVLDAIRAELRRRNYIPLLFDFDKPASRDLTETVMTLAGMSRFVIADLSDPHSIPHELMSFAEKLLSVPVQAIFSPVPEHQWAYPMFEHLARYPHVLPIYRYDSQEQLIAMLSEHVIAPAEAKVDEMRFGGTSTEK